MKRIPKYSVVELVDKKIMGKFRFVLKVYPNKKDSVQCIEALERKNEGRVFELHKEWVNKKKRSWR